MQVDARTTRRAYTRAREGKYGERAETAASQSPRAYGAARATSFGHGTVVFGADRFEEFLVVERRQGQREWRWQLGTQLTPRLGADGTIHLEDRGRRALRILPVRILDVHAHDVTPASARWTVRRRGGGWTLGLSLDDRKLPLPYVIDPSTAPDGAGTVTTGAAPTVGASLTITFTFTNTDSKGISAGAVEMTVPAGWPAPTAVAGQGQVTTSTGSLSFAGQVFTISNVTVASGSTFTFTYTGTPTVAGAQTWSVREKSTVGGTLTAI